MFPGSRGQGPVVAHRYEGKFKRISARVRWSINKNRSDGLWLLTRDGYPVTTFASQNEAINYRSPCNRFNNGWCSCRKECA